MSPMLPAASSITHSPLTSTLPLASYKHERDRDREYPPTPVSTVSPAKVYPDASRSLFFSSPVFQSPLFPHRKGPANELLAPRVTSNSCDFPCTNGVVHASESLEQQMLCNQYVVYILQCLFQYVVISFQGFSSFAILTGPGLLNIPSPHDPYPHHNYVTFSRSNSCTSLHVTLYGYFDSGTLVPSLPPLVVSECER
ncbi:hypothetical protein AX14_004716 [Amanita brunnescens Koide BX004]|nr:hypothetical protein AX14_004716 [Amanita brunnescens Koide BX004]